MLEREEIKVQRREILTSTANDKTSLKYNPISIAIDKDERNIYCGSSSRDGDRWCLGMVERCRLGLELAGSLVVALAVELS